MSARFLPILLVAAGLIVANRRKRRGMPDIAAGTELHLID